MTARAAPRTILLIRRHSDLLITAVVLSAVAMMVVPLPTAVIDVLLALNIALAAVLLMVAVHVGDALRIATFPTILLIATLFRLGLNVSTTRAILAHADAGEVVASFASVVVAGSLVVGIIVFLIITLIQFAVVARGAERVAEVAARFTLDAMPGKQMAIDADVRAGLIDHAEAGRRRALIERQSQFYGAMDGAMKFVKGDAIAAVLITLINLIGGLIVGVGARGMSVGEAAQVFSMLSIGDGLVAQLPALLIALAAGLIVTRVASEDDGAHVGRDIVAQILAEPRAIAAAAVLLAGLAAIPGLPAVPFLIAAALAGVVAASLRRRREPDATRDRDAIELNLASPRPIEVVLSPALARSVGDADLLSGVRQRVFDAVGAVIPPIDVRVEPAQAEPYRICVLGLIVERGSAPTDRADDALARWLADRIERHVTRCASGFVGIQEVTTLLDRLAEERPAVVRQVVPALIGVPRLTAVLRRLISQRISIRDLAEVLHAVAAWAPRTPDIATLCERVRADLRRQITSQYAPDGAIAVWRLDPLIEDTVRSAARRSELGEYLALEPALARDILAAIERAIDADAAPAIVLAHADVRRHIAALIEPALPDLVVLSADELFPTTAVHTRAVIEAA